jgi:hypothetical protein
MSSIRDVLVKLDDMPAQPLTQACESGPVLQENEVLRVLEASERSVAWSEKLLTRPQAQVRLVTPQDSWTLCEYESDAESNASPCFAVQLVWSVSPIDVKLLPPLAIFDSYTLYNVEGKRDGRKWFALRLGFFSDAAAATQVANYVRSDFRAAAIVPVALTERKGADGCVGRTPESAAQAVKEAPPPVIQSVIGGKGTDGFELLQDDRPAPLRLDLDDRPSPREAAHIVPVIQPVGRPDPIEHTAGRFSRLLSRFSAN